MSPEQKINQSFFKLGESVKSVKLLMRTLHFHFLCYLPRPHIRFPTDSLGKTCSIHT